MTDPRYPIGRFTPPSSFTPASRAESIAALASTPSALRAAVAGLTADQLRTPYRDGGWTVAQVVHHLADSHMNAYIRMKLALTETDPIVKTYDENRWAELPDASDADVSASLALVESLHVRLVAMLRALAPDDFSRPFVHPERGPMTIDRNVALYAWHGHHHAAHITALRARMGW